MKQTIDSLDLVFENTYKDKKDNYKTRVPYKVESLEDRLPRLNQLIFKSSKNRRFNKYLLFNNFRILTSIPCSWRDEMINDNQHKPNFRQINKIFKR